MPVFTVTAANAPAIQIPSSVTSITGAVPTSNSSDYLISGDTATVLAPKTNRNAVRLELTATYGGVGAYAVASGWELSVSSGLTAAISTGIGVVQGLVQTVSAATQVCTDNVYNWLWMTQAGTIALATQVAGTPAPSVPSGGKIFLGRILASGGSLTEFDYSGRCELRGGVLWRRTGDVGAPTDSPSANIKIITRTLSGQYFWDGSAHWALGGTSGVVPENIVSGSTFAIPQYYQTEVFGCLIVAGTLHVAGRLRIVP